MQAKDRIILALDVDSMERALELVNQLKDYVGSFKIGMQLYNSVGPNILTKIMDDGGRVFLDLKFHDIPNTVGAVSRVVAHRGCWMFNVHAAGGAAMMEAAARSSQEEALNMGKTPPLVLGVTVLTSLSQEQLNAEIGIPESVEEIVSRWALLAKESGLDGVVASPREVKAIRQACGNEFLIVTPGVRPLWAGAQDQKRVTTPREAVDSGADYLVIGRPITGADNPVEAAQKIIKELEE